MLCPLIPLPDPPEPHTPEVDDEFVAFLRNAHSSGRIPLLATDGGCLIKARMAQWRRAAWAVVAYDEGNVCIISALVGGPEQTPAAAEREAILAAAVQLDAAGVAARLVIDNDAAVRRLLRGLHHGRWHGDLEPFWRGVGLRLLKGTEVAWIPSHDKQSQWRPPDWGVDADLLRYLNRRADRACTVALASVRPSWQHFTELCEEAHAWADTALTVLDARTEGYHAQLRDHYRGFDPLC